VSGTIEVRIAQEKGYSVVHARDASVAMGRAPDGSDARDAFRAGELLIGALGTCISGTVRAYARTHGIGGLDDLSIRVEADEEDSPSRVAAIRVFLEFPDSLGEAERAKVLRAAKACKIHNSLSHAPSIEVGSAP
jgi:uncharacterized OsmC-like protein